MKLEDLCKWLEDDGHAGCAEDLLCAKEEDRPHLAHQIADHVEEDHYDDDEGRALAPALREWADREDRT
jgi:hypothetical protein